MVILNLFSEKLYVPPLQEIPIKSTRHEAVISIKGMTCHACVNNIQDNISKKPGIFSINVDLIGEQGQRLLEFTLNFVSGVVIFDNSITNAAAVAEAIDDMGFDAQLMASRGGIINSKES